MNTTTKARNRILSLALAVCLLLTMTLVVPGPVEVYALPNAAAGRPYDGVDIGGLVGDGIYFGTYDHAMGMTWSNILGQYENPAYEGADTPVLWRVLGEEIGNDNLTLLSEYVLDIGQFNPSGASHHYPDSTLQTTMESMSGEIFSGAETQAAVRTDVVTRRYDMIGADRNIGLDGTMPYPTTAQNQIMYPLWGIATGSYANTVYWDAEPAANGYTYDLSPYAAKLKDGAAYTSDIDYWLRSPSDNSSNTALIVRNSTTLRERSVNYSQGIRPAFQLDPTNILFVSEVKPSAAVPWETEADGTNYSQAASGANYKLTVVNDGIGALAGMPAGNPTVSLMSGETLYLNNLAPSGTGGDYTVNYKIVNNTGPRTIDYYGSADAEEVTDLALSGIADGSYTVYVWLQKNNDIHSHEGTTPGYLTLNVSNAGDTYGLALDTAGLHDFGSEQQGYDPALLEKTVQITTSGSTSNLSVRLGGADRDKFAVSAIGSGNQFTIAPLPGLPVGVYEATVTVTGDYAPAQEFRVAFEVTAGDTNLPSATPPTLSLHLQNNPTGTVQLSLGMSGDGVTPLATGATARSSDTGVATVAPGPFATEATITATGKGTATVTFTFDDPDATTAAVAVTVTDGRNQGGSSSSGGTSTPDSRVAKTQLPASAFSWDGERTLTINHDSITLLGLLSVQWDGETLTRGADYSVHSGSVIVRFSEDFIAAQAPGEHTVRVEFLNHTGETVIPLGIQGGSSGGSGGAVDNTDTHNPDTGGWPDSGMGTIDNPNTGDGRGIWPALLLGSLGGVILVVRRLRPVA